MNGVDEAIVERANELVSLSARGQDLVAACARISKSEEAILEKTVCVLLFLAVFLRTTQLNFLSLYRSRLHADSWNWTYRQIG